MDGDLKMNAVPAGGQLPDQPATNLRAQNISLDVLSWEAINDIAKREGISVLDLLCAIQTSAKKNTMKSATRLFILKYYRGMAARYFQ